MEKKGKSNNIGNNGEINKKFSAGRSISHDYELPEIEGEIKCPSCDSGTIEMKRTIHKLPDGDEILILLMECNNCTFKQND
ncbi:MAG: hypothetical protein ACTSWY_09435, partial [Promethearchaeota archaeon]